MSSKSEGTILNHRKKVNDMIDYKLFEVLTILEKMIGKESMYLTDAAKSGNLKELVISFDSKKDSNGVSVKVQHGVTLSWEGVSK